MAPKHWFNVNTRLILIVIVFISTILFSRSPLIPWFLCFSLSYSHQVESPSFLLFSSNSFSDNFNLKFLLKLLWLMHVASIFFRVFYDLGKHWIFVIAILGNICLRFTVLFFLPSNTVRSLKSSSASKPDIDVAVQALNNL